jgi:hypothetical protein
MISRMEDFTSGKAFRVSDRHAFERAGITPADVDHPMIYDAFAHLLICGLENLGTGRTACIPAPKGQRWPWLES